MRDRDILESNVELLGTLEKLGTDTVGHLLTLGDELGGVELRNDGFENFVTDRGEDALVVVGTERL